MELSPRGYRPRIGRRLTDAALVLACLVLTAAAAKGHWSPLPRPVIVAAGVTGSLAQCWRRRWPTLAAMAGATAYTLSGNPAPALAGLYAGTVYAPRRRLWIAAVTGGAAYAAWARIDGGRITWTDAQAAAGIAVVVTAIGQYAAARKATAESGRRQAELAEAERKRAEAEQGHREEQARIAERERIAREMHDLLAHKLSLIAVHAGALELAASGQAGPLEQGAGLIRVTTRQALQELRYVLGLLRNDAAAWPLKAHEEGGEPFADLLALVEACERLGQRIELHDLAGPLPSATARVVYRIAQEGMTNARKHAPGAPVAIRVERAEEGALTVTVDNPAASTPPLDLPGSGTGLIGLAERVRLVGGDFHSGPRGADQGGGWRLRAVLPWLDHHLD
jgi:signal transduction histidine kinase